MYIYCGVLTCPPPLAPPPNPPHGSPILPPRRGQRGSKSPSRSCSDAEEAQRTSLPRRSSCTEACAEAAAQSRWKFNSQTNATTPFAAGGGASLQVTERQTCASFPGAWEKPSRCASAAEARFDAVRSSGSRAAGAQRGRDARRASTCASGAHPQFFGTRPMYHSS